MHIGIERVLLKRLGPESLALKVLNVFFSVSISVLLLNLCLFLALLKHLPDPIV